MESFQCHEGIGVPLRRSNVDTDQILAAEYLKRVTRTGYEDALFVAWRKDPDFVLNREPYRAGTVLVAGANFGVGSSREHAVWALTDYGFRAIVSPSFADIFRGNAGKNGLLTAQCSEQDVERIWVLLERQPGACVTVDLVERSVRADAFSCQFAIDEYTRWRLLEGLDDIDLTLRQTDRIAAYEATRPTWLPTTKGRTT